MLSLYSVVCEAAKQAPEATVQTCIVRLLRRSLDFVSWKIRKAVARRRAMLAAFGEGLTVREVGADRGGENRVCGARRRGSECL
ncbi:hypothetical protein ACFW16_20125 [Inquilinus sp. NPDC058860]|uniref:hypothetical protein n=1 Tax=Inquilinus sp. NPDC058860 TaxID=3346652 RepID=UPI0036AA40F5